MTLKDLVDLWLLGGPVLLAVLALLIVLSPFFFMLALMPPYGC